jgi:putative transposase
MLARKRGQADLLYRKSSDTFLLAVTVDAPEPEPGEPQPADYLGVDLGIITLAATSDGEFLNHSTGPKHAHINQVRARYSRFRTKLQKTGTNSSFGNLDESGRLEAERAGTRMAPAIVPVGTRLSRRGIFEQARH